MLLKEEEDKAAVKQWLLPQLEVISDAQPEVLADYVIALVCTDGPVSAVRKNATEALSEFLQERAGPFIDRVILGIQKKSWAKRSGSNGTPSGKLEARSSIAKSAAAPLQRIPSVATSAAESYAPKTASTTNTQSHGGHTQAMRRAPQPSPFLRPPPTGPAAMRTPPSTSTRNNQGNQSLKRKLDNEAAGNQANGEQNLFGSAHAGNRPLKRQTARRGGTSLHGYATGNERSGPLNGLRGLPVPNTGLASQPGPPTLPQFDFSSSATLAAAMVNMFGMGFPIVPPTNGSTSQPLLSMRCRSFDLQGFCILGTACPFDHTSTSVVAGVPEYDPTRPSLAFQSKSTNTISFAPSQRKNLKDHRAKAGQPTGLVRSTKLVVEQIPEDCLSQNSVRQFFSQFGTIVSVQLETRNRTAIVEFKDHDMAQRAYDSPKVIFDNRFVRVYWDHMRFKQGQGLNKKNGGDEDQSAARYRTVRVHASPADANIPEIYNEDVDMIDIEAFEKQQEEAQRAFEERQKKMEQRNAEAEEIERKLRTSEQEINAIRTRLAEKARARGEEEIDKREKANNSSDDAILNNLSLLHAEAEGLFAKRGSNSSWTPPPRGGFQGRGFGRGTFRGRGGRGKLRCSVKRVDNRPRRLAIAGIESGTGNEAAARSYLENMEGCDDVQPHMERPDTLIASFSERYLAEKFLDEATYIPGVGRLRLSWVPNGESVAIGSSEQEAVPVKADTDHDSGTSNELDADEITIKEEDFDLDVAEDADQWG